MSVKIRLKRLGKVKVPQYRIVVVDSRKKRDGKVIEEIGHYRPKEDPSFVSVVSERAQYWLGVGAQPSDAVAKLLKLTGDWQQHKGLPGTEGTLRTAEPKRDKTEVFNEALKEAGNEPKSAAVTKKSKKADEKSAEKAEPKADEKAEPKAEDKPADEAADPAGESAAADVPPPNAVPGAETPEGAAAEAEAAEAKVVDAEQSADKA